MPYFQFSRGLVAALALVGVAGAAAAEDLALVIGNRNYDHASTMYDAEDALNSARALRANGYKVVSGGDLGTVETVAALEDLVSRMDDADRVVVILNGHFAHSSGDTWFIPVDQQKLSIARIDFLGVSINNLLDIVAEKPGGAAVFLGTQDRRIELGAGLDAGIGALDVPQGVFVVSGRPGDIDQAVRRNFLVEGAGYISALADSPDSIQAQGYVSNFSSLLPSEGIAPEVDEDALIERGYWEFATDLGTKDSFEAYLNRYPLGLYASDANDWLNDEAAKTPEALAEEAEKALALSRTDRRQIQSSLTLLGFDTRGVDGLFGRGSRGAISAWQHENGMPATGFISGPQIQRLNRQAAIRSEELAEEARKLQEARDRADQAYWQRTGSDGTEDGLRTYLRRYPDGLFADVANGRLQRIEDEKRENANRADRAAWQTAAEANNLESYQGYLDEFPRGAFVNEAMARITEIEDAESNSVETEAAKAEEQALGLNGFARVIIQKQLNALGLKAGRENGEFGDRTRAAIRRFQTSRGLPVSGYVTRQTMVRLIAESAGR